MTHPQMIAPAWREQDVPPECLRCGGPPDRAHDCIDPTTIPTPKEAPVAIKRDLSDLPPANGLTPDESPRFAPLLAEWWATRDSDHVPSGKAFIHSDAGKCARAISYRLAKIPKSDPMDLPGWHNVELGTLIHEAWQEALPAMFTVERAQAMFPDRSVVSVGINTEVEVGHEDIDSIGFIDAVVAIIFAGGPDYVIAIELKSIGGWGFKNAIGKARKNSPAEGPKDEHLLQAALNGAAIDADEIVVAYIAKECLSATQYNEADPLSRFTAEWAFTREQYEPLARDEMARMAKVHELNGEGLLAPRKLPDMPPRSEITDPSTGEWQQVLIDEDGTEMLGEVGNAFWCSYCSYQTLCATTEAGRIPIDTVVTIGAVA